jgi:cobalt/nickel transport system permease protein
MHLPNDFLNPGTASALLGAAAGAFVLAVAKVRTAITQKIKVLNNQLVTEPQSNNSSTSLKITEQGKEKMYALASMAALIFSLQMVNFPIAGGTSGHFVGGVLAFFVLGPWSAIIAIFIVIAVQALFFADGGLFSLGANIFNMGVLTVLTAYGIQLLIKNKKYLYSKIFIAAFLSVIIAATATSVEMAIAGKSSLGLILPVMLKYHTLVGLGEGVITLTVIYLLTKYKYKLWINEKTDEK